ncbi:unnamed protein product [Rodentolepis nana]|uniref:Aldedh domain-containing protein n=1 Tax=Rodentolepis nana TaxID=102285 RepID=A0A0R3THJ5_RODNA|nr:unnamed protein product [Rodentolepis nana]
MFDITKLKVPFVDREPSSISERKQTLKRLLDFLTDNEDDLYKVLKADLRKVSRTPLSFFDNTSIQRQPYGRVLVIGAWNYPINVLFVPFIGALGAGNAVVLKPSEMASETEAYIAKHLPNYIDEACLPGFMGFKC